MNIEKKIISNLNKCYSLAELSYQGKHCFLAAAEKKTRAIFLQKTARSWKPYGNSQGAL